jgi:hypothetical protein
MRGSRTSACSTRSSTRAHPTSTGRPSGDYAHLATSSPRHRCSPIPPTPVGRCPNDRIQAAGLALDLQLNDARRTAAGWRDARWWERGPDASTWTGRAGPGGVSLFQSGPKPDRIPPVPESTPTSARAGSSPSFTGGAAPPARAERADGWLDITDDRRGVAVGIRHFIEEYPKELAIDESGQAQRVHLVAAGRRHELRPQLRHAPGSEGRHRELGAGLAKTSELVFYFHPASTPARGHRADDGLRADAAGGARGTRVVRRVRRVRHGSRRAPAPSRSFSARSTTSSTGCSSTSAGIRGTACSITAT